MKLLPSAGCDARHTMPMNTSFLTELSKALPVYPGDERLSSVASGAQPNVE